jgi:phthalate 4,5-dioxygenase reductase component
MTEVPAKGSNPDSGELRLTVCKKEQIASDVFMFELRSLTGSALPAFTAGAHITVTAPSGQKRRYSLCNDCNERDRYVIAIKQERGGRGGSLSMARDLNEGDQIAIEPPANDFEMSRVEPKTFIFIAGGIGITPIRAMILHCIRQNKLNFRLYYFTRTPDLTAFRDEFTGPDYEGRAVIHHDNGDPEQAYDLWRVLEEQKAAHLYCCGPRGLMDAVRDMTGHWSDSSVHFEDFVGASGTRPDDKPFEARLAKSGKSYQVPMGVSILDTLRQNGHALASSCESGTCGTCRTRFIAGDPDHRDLVLSDNEQKSQILICVSRAKTETLTLDI